MKLDVKKFVRRPSRREAIVVTGGLLVLSLLASPAFYFYNKYVESQRLLANPNAVAEEKVKDVIEKVGAHLQLPSGETPRLATVSNKEKLKEQSFFDKAENGDKVLIYEKAKKAFLYRPSTDKVINVAPIIDPFNGQAPEAAVPAASTSAEPVPITAEAQPTSAPIAITVLNGTTTSGLAKSMGLKVTELVPGADITTGNAENADYAYTVVVDVDGTQKKIVKSLAAQLQASVAALPSGETKPKTASILVIVGAKNVLR